MRPEVHTEELRNADDAYGHFFGMSAHSHFSEAIILTHQIFHRPGGHLYDDTMSFERILDLILCQASLMPEALIAIADEWSSARATHGKIKLLRNKWMAHRDLSYTETTVFVEADLTPFQLAEQIERGKRLHNILGDVLNTGEYRFDLDPSEDLRRLLVDLRSVPREGTTGFTGAFARIEATRAKP